MTIHIKNLKVRQRKGTSLYSFLTCPLTSFHLTAAVNVMCAPQLASMLGCWAASNDLKSVGQCKEAAEALFHCMRTTVSPALFLLTFNSFIPRSLCPRKHIDQQLTTTSQGWASKYNRFPSSCGSVAVSFHHSSHGCIVSSHIIY